MNVVHQCAVKVLRDFSINAPVPGALHSFLDNEQIKTSTELVLGENGGKKPIQTLNFSWSTINHLLKYKKNMAE